MVNFNGIFKILSLQKIIHPGQKPLSLPPIQFIQGTLQFITVTLFLRCNLYHLCVVLFINNLKIKKMEKLRFTIRFIAILAALPVIMFIELTRSEKGTIGQKRDVEKVSVETNQSATLTYASFFLQAVYI